MTYHWREKRGPAGKQMSLIDAHGKEVAFVQASFPDWMARHVIDRFSFYGTKDACLAEVEKWFGIEKAQKTGKQGELFRNG